MSAPLTFLFTDLENSTTMGERAPQAMREALAQHDALLRDVIERHHGSVVKDTEDGFMSAFDGGRQLSGRRRRPSELTNRYE